MSQGYRAVGMLKNEAIVWFWIGSHADYDRLLSRLQDMRFLVAGVT